MTENHPIRPPHELVQQWVSLACENEGYETWQDLATQAARWGADQELEACCEWLKAKEWIHHEFSDELRATRRPKPPSLKEQALKALEDDPKEGAMIMIDMDQLNTIRLALESLPD